MKDLGLNHLKTLEKLALQGKASSLNRKKISRTVKRHYFSFDRIKPLYHHGKTQVMALSIRPPRRKLLANDA